MSTSELTIASVVLKNPWTWRKNYDISIFYNEIPTWKALIINSLFDDAVMEEKKNESALICIFFTQIHIKILSNFVSSPELCAS